ncbi:MAG: hypothetical protein FJW38_12465 [Acidobacteria bacterium]|nr:hypothetical protein [Acidobacteriota bacterium]
MALVIVTILLVFAGPMLLPLLTRAPQSVPYLETAVVIDGVKVKGAVEKWANGKLSSGILESDRTIPAGSEVLGTPAEAFVINVFRRSGKSFEIPRPR